MAYMPRVRVELDGVPVELQLAQGDYIRAESDGHRFAEGESSHVALACVTWHALKRNKRKGLIDVEIPESWDDFLDALSFADDQPEETDPKGSPPVQPTGE